MVEHYALPPAEIESLSLRRVAQATPDLESWPVGAQQVARRMIYAAGDPSLAPLIRIHPEAVEAGVRALRGGCTVVTDVRMVEVALDRKRLTRFGCTARCAIDAPAVSEEARAVGLPRALLAIRSLAAELDGAVVVVGNAPTALLALLDLVDACAVSPALIIGIPVGFVAAAESKCELEKRAAPYITVTGTRGGSAIAAAALNALLRLAEES